MTRTSDNWQQYTNNIAAIVEYGQTKGDQSCAQNGSTIRIDMELLQ